jgi:outer membrane protein OmpA-like peptidoglycan-associated protein
MSSSAPFVPYAAQAEQLPAGIAVDEESQRAAFLQGLALPPTEQVRRYTFADFVAESIPRPAMQDPASAFVPALAVPGMADRAMLERLGAAQQAPAAPVAAATGPTAGDSAREFEVFTRQLGAQPGAPVGMLPNIGIASADCTRSLAGMVLGETVNFATGSSQIPAGMSLKIDQLAWLMRNCPAARIEIAGHTDNIGGPAANRRLSERRARRVVEALVERGIDARRLSAVGYGTARPLADNGSEAGRAVNRRIEIGVLSANDSR